MMVLALGFSISTIIGASQEACNMPLEAMLIGDIISLLIMMILISIAILYGIVVYFQKRAKFIDRKIYFDKKKEYNEKIIKERREQFEETKRNSLASNNRGLFQSASDNEADDFESRHIFRLPKKIEEERPLANQANGEEQTEMKTMFSEKAELEQRADSEDSNSKKDFRNQNSISDSPPLEKSGEVDVKLPPNIQIEQENNSSSTIKEKATIHPEEERPSPDAATPFVMIISQSKDLEPPKIQVNNEDENQEAEAESKQQVVVVVEEEEEEEETAEAESKKEEEKAKPEEVVVEMEKKAGEEVQEKNQDVQVEKEEDKEDKGSGHSFLSTSPPVMRRKDSISIYKSNPTIYTEELKNHDEQEEEEKDQTTITLCQNQKYSMFVSFSI